MSRIITPTTTITLTIDNRMDPPQCTLQCSQDMPIPAVVQVLAAMISKLMADLARNLYGAGPAALPSPPGSSPGNPQGTNGGGS